MVQSGQSQPQAPPYTSPPGGAPAASEEPPDPLVGKTLDNRYLIESILGQGGMGVVYAARHTIIGKRIAIKVLKREFVREKEIVDRFMLEARTASSIGNPHIVDISDFGTTPEGATYFVMEFLEGQSLTDAISEPIPGVAPGAEPQRRPKPIDTLRICRIARQICDGLGAAHEAKSATQEPLGIVHRDLKPDNIFLINRPVPGHNVPGSRGDFVKILDFGIAKVSNSSAQKLTRAGAVFGTPHYMSAEQAAGGALDHRSDIYSLGVILYEMASGELPFNEDTFMGILTAHMYRAPAPVRTRVHGAQCPAQLEAVIQKCLSKRPELRYQHMSELAEDLRRIEANEMPQAVADMMGRQGDSIPQDYLRSGGHMSGGAMAQTGPVQVPIAKPRAPLWIWPVTLFAAVGIIASGVMYKRYRDTQVTAASTAATTAAPAPSVSAPVVATAAPAATTAQPVATASAATPTTTHVTLKLTPTNATVKRDGLALASPALDLKPGEKATLEVSAPGFVTKTFDVDGTKPEVVAELVHAGGGAPATPVPIQLPPQGGHGYVDTWGGH